MCGIAGILSTHASGGLEATVGKMLDAQAHRGPDGRGVWLEERERGSVALGHVRLSILDLTAAAAQPMATRDGRFHMVYNGELYNFEELRADLRREGVDIVSSGDTEVLLAALAVWGRSSFRRLNGMWALALYDSEARSLLLSRDRFGEKPLYFYRDEGRLVFASEIKALLPAIPGKLRVDPMVASRFLGQFMLDAQDETFFGGIRAVTAGTCMEIDLGKDGLPALTFPYWEIPETAPVAMGERDLHASLRELFLDSVRIRLRSDVPTGVLLSGGVDSSAIAGACRAVLGPDKAVHAVSAVSRDTRFSEEPFVDRVSSAMNATVHKFELDDDPAAAFSALPGVIRFNDQPVAGFSAVAHFRLMQMARKAGITVLLSGQGADELLCGYRKYVGFYLQDLARSGHFLDAARVLASFAARRTVLSQFSWREAKRYLPWPLRLESVDVRHARLRSEARLDLGVADGGLIGRQVADLKRFSVPQLCHYEDRMSMACSREIRLPFLDHRLVELLVPLAERWKLRDGWTKHVFRRAMSGIVREDVLWRKDKRGFSNPQERWLKEDLASEITKLLSGDLAVADFGLVDADALRTKWARYLREPVGKGRTDVREVFCPLATELWLRAFEEHLRPGD